MLHQMHPHVMQAREATYTHKTSEPVDLRCLITYVTQLLRAVKKKTGDEEPFWRSHGIALVLAFIVGLGPLRSARHIRI
jgi:hypothetical protein